MNDTITRMSYKRYKSNKGTFKLCMYVCRWWNFRGMWRGVEGVVEKQQQQQKKYWGTQIDILTEFLVE